MLALHDAVVERWHRMTRRSSKKALVYHGPGQKAWQDVPDPAIIDPTDVIVALDTTTICGTDLHILKGGRPDGDRWPDPGP